MVLVIKLSTLSVENSNVSDIYNGQICILPGLYLPYFRAYNISFLMFPPDTSSPTGLGILGHILITITNV